MSTIELTWVNADQTAIRWDVRGRVDWDMITRSLHQLYGMLDTVDNPVDLVIQVEVTTAPPKIIPNLSRIMNKRRHPQLRRKIVVGASDFIQMMILLTIRSHRDQTNTWFFVDTLQDAYNIALSSNAATVG